MYRKIGQLSLRKNKGKVANDYLTQTHEKRDLKIQASFCIIYLERLSDALSDCPQLKFKC